MSNIPDLSNFSKDELHELIENAVNEFQRRSPYYLKSLEYKMMHRKPPLQILLRGCISKVQYQNMAYAESMAKKYTGLLGVTSSVYECPQCGFWHITTKKPRPNNKLD